MRSCRMGIAIMGSALLSGCAGMSQERSEKRFVTQHLGKPAQDFELTAIDGAKVRLSDHRGKPVLLAFFAYG